MKYYLGIDVGGTNISAGVCNENHDLLSGTRRIKTNTDRPYGEILSDIISVGQAAIDDAGITIDNISWIGIGCPGICDKKSGVVKYSSNLMWENIPVKDDLEIAFGVDVYLENDANVAAIGECLAGAAKGVKNAIIITLGTGVGAGVIIEGKIFTGTNFAGAEVGHTVIEMDGRECSCGRKGCFEAYSSAVALTKITKEAAGKNPSSKIYEVVEKEGKFSARTAFAAARLGDETAQEVVDYYIKYLACGIANTINIFQPDILCIGGGVCNEGDYLLEPLKQAVYDNVFFKNEDSQTEITICQMGNAAGIIGAAMLGELDYEGKLEKCEANC